jgi:hypothetical protein
MQSSGRPIAFGYKTAWLAAKNISNARLFAALGLRDLGEINWEQGLKHAYSWAGDNGYGRFVFVTPPLAGWTLCVSTGFFAYGDQEQPTFTALVKGLSGKLSTAVLYFSTHRVVEYHAWARATNGMLERAYAYVGESGKTLVDAGPRTPEENALGLRFFDERSPDAKSEWYWTRKDLTYPNEGYVMRLAGEWSVNPATLGEDHDEVPFGTLAEFIALQAGANGGADPAGLNWRALSG